MYTPDIEVPGHICGDPKSYLDHILSQCSVINETYIAPKAISGTGYGMDWISPGGANKHNNF